MGCNVEAQTKTDSDYVTAIYTYVFLNVMQILMSLLIE